MIRTSAIRFAYCYFDKRCFIVLVLSLCLVLCSARDRRRRLWSEEDHAIDVDASLQDRSVVHVTVGRGA